MLSIRDLVDPNYGDINAILNMNMNIVMNMNI